MKYKNKLLIKARTNSKKVHQQIEKDLFQISIKTMLMKNTIKIS